MKIKKIDEMFFKEEIKTKKYYTALLYADLLWLNSMYSNFENFTITPKDVLDKLIGDDHTLDSYKEEIRDFALKVLAFKYELKNIVYDKAIFEK